MRRSLLLPLVASVTIGSASGLANAGTLEDSLEKLDPEERAKQACIIFGVDKMKRDKALANVDRMKTGISTPAILAGETLTAKGGAVRAKQKWFALTFTCTLAPEHKKATAFVYKVGEEIPHDKWEDLGLW